MPEKMISTITKKQISESVSRVLNDPVGSDFSSGTTRSAPVDVPIHDENCRQTHSISLSAPIDVPIPEDNRRSTYSTSLACPAPSSESLFATSEEESKHLIPVRSNIKHILLIILHYSFSWESNFFPVR